MSKIDVTTAIIVVVLVLALGFLGYQLYQLYVGQDPTPANRVLDTPQTRNDSFPGDMYSFPNEDDGLPADTSSFFSDTEPDSGPSSPVGGKVDTKTEPTGEGDYMVLAGTFSVKDFAEDHARRIRSLGYPGATVRPMDRGTYHVVRVDHFASESRAEELVRELKTQHKIEAYVHKKRTKPVERQSETGYPSPF